MNDRASQTTRPTRCPHCHGSGITKVPALPLLNTCPTVNPAEAWFEVATVDCRACGGTGRIVTYG